MVGSTPVQVLTWVRERDDDPAPDRSGPLRPLRRSGVRPSGPGHRRAVVLRSPRPPARARTLRHRTGCPGRDAAPDRAARSEPDDLSRLGAVAAAKRRPRSAWDLDVLVVGTAPATTPAEPGRGERRQGRSVADEQAWAVGAIEVGRGRRGQRGATQHIGVLYRVDVCLLYTSDAADDLICVDL